MNIQVRVLSAQARAQIKSLEAELRALETRTGSAGSAMNGMGSRGIPGLSKWGNQVQWAGRQLQYNFTLPILLAGGAAAKFALDNEKAMTRVIKVYGDGSAAFNQLSKTEIPALEKAFEALSSRFGIAQADAINIAADWAAAGASGLALAKSVKLTMETMILGEMDAASATQALIAIQAQYGQSVEQLSKTIDILNMVENQTGISMEGLVQGFARAAGVARSAGIDTRHLAAMLAALTPAAGSAAQAGNALKTIVSRLLSPTKEATEVMGLMGINTKNLAWQSLNGSQRLEQMAKSFQGLDDAQKAVVSSVMASRYQINKFDVLMRDMINTNGYYKKALDATESAQTNFNQRVRELNAVLNSNPQRLKQIWTILQNAMADVIQPMIPVILLLASELSRLVTWFSNLDPAVQKLVLGFALVLAAIGPIARYIGSVSVLLGLLSEAAHFAALKFFGLGRVMGTALMAPFSMLGSAIGAIVGALGGMVTAAGRALGSVAAAVGGIVRAQLGIVATAARVSIFQMLNTMRAIIITSMTLMGRNMLVIWGSTWTRMGALMAAGGGRLAVMMRVLSANILQSMRMMAIGMAAGGRAMVIALAANFRRLVMLAPMAMTRIVAILRAAGPLLVTALTTWWVWAIAAALGLIYAFRDDLRKIWDNISRDAVGWLQPVANVWGSAVQFIEKMFWRLPSSVRDAILTVVHIIAAAAKQVYEWFSYLNPFAHHSPSLVEQVTAGMAVIKKQYASVGNVGSIFSKAANDLAAYKNAISGLGAGPFSDERMDVGKAFPKMLPLFDTLIGDLGQLNAVLKIQEAAVAAQQAVVDRWKVALDNANDALDREQATLDVLQNKLDALTSAYESHKSAMEGYANAPLKGMGAMEDKIFANEMAQKKLRLEMMKFEEVNGSIEDIQGNMARLAGSIEMLRGEAASLRSAGAGSDILGPINDQIKQMEAAYSQMGGAVQDNPGVKMQTELERLQKEAEKLDLEKSLNFDPMTREIQKLADTTKELSFDEITIGIKNERAAMATLQPQIDSATAAVVRQQTAVDKAKAARDAIQNTYDAENKKLQTLQDEYSKTEQAIRDIESALRDMGSTASAQNQKAADAARKAKDAYMSPGAENFLAAKGGNFPDVGGNAKIGREGGMGDQSKLIDDFTKGINDDITKQFGSFDMFKPIKDAWNKAWAWIKTNVGPSLQGVVDGVTSWWNGFGGDFSKSGPVKSIGDAWENIKSGASTAWTWIQHIIDLFKDDFSKIAQEVVKYGKRIWTDIAPELAKFGKLFPDIQKLLGILWNSFKIVAAVVGGAVLLAFKILTSIFANTLGPILDTIIGVIENVIQVLRGLAEFVIGVLTGDWKMAWQGIVDILSGTVGVIWSLLKGFAQTAWGIVKGFVEGIVDFFKWLYDVLVGHSIIPDMVKDIISWIASLPGKAATALKNFGSKIVDVAKAAWKWFKDTSTAAWSGIASWIAAIPQSAYNKIIDIKNKLKSAAQTAWDYFKTGASSKWESIKTWIAAMPQSAYDKIIAMKTKLSDAAKAAFQALWDKAKAIVDGRGGLIAWVAGIPGKIAHAMSGVGSAVTGAVKTSWNAAAGWLNKNGLANVNKITEKFGLHINSLPGFAGGGVIPGRVSKTDNTIIRARTGEGVIVPELVKALGGAKGLAVANNAAKRGSLKTLAQLGVPGYRDGGVIGQVAGGIGDMLKNGAGNALASLIGAAQTGVRKVIPGRPFFEDYMAGGVLQQWKDKAKSWGDKQESTGNGALPGIGWQYQVAALKKQFPGIIITSTSRPGAITASGNTSYHSMGRAVDMAPDMKYFDWIRKTYGKNTKELIYSPAGNKQLKNGAPYTYTGAVKDMHYNHVHWAYDQGGILRPGLTMAYNGTGKDEVTLTNGDWQTFSNVVSMMDRMTQKSGVAGAPGGSTMARTGATLASLEGRLRNIESRTGTVPGYGSGSGVTVVINGDLSFPNLKSGDDAETFIRHLETLAG